MSEIFVAYAAGDEFQSKLIESACESASTPHRKIISWSQRNISGAPIARSVEGWIENSDAFIADISVVNPNVTYEIGYAIGLGKPIRLIRSRHKPFKPIINIGLLDTLAHETYDFEKSLKKLLVDKEPMTEWGGVEKNKDQPLFFLQTPLITDSAIRVTSAIKKIARMRFRNFNPAEISRLNASEAYQHVISSFGIICFWLEGDSEVAVRNNQRAAFMYGVASGSGIPTLLIAHEQMRLPLDLEDKADRWRTFNDLDKMIGMFRLRVADGQNDFVTVKRADRKLLELLNCGDPVAENEASSLSHHFLPTDAFNRALVGQANIMVGRKGSGKTAIFLQIRDRCRANRENIVIDLMPDGHQLVKMKEFILDELSFGARKEVIAAFWEYVIWLEIAYKLLEKDEVRSLRDPVLFREYDKLKNIFYTRVDTGAGDFSERLKRLADNVIQRFIKSGLKKDELNQLDSSSVLQSIYGQDVKILRDGVLNYLHLKGFVYFLFDNLDRFWTPGGFTPDDALIVVGLAESMQEIARKFRREKLDFLWAIFIRSDVYEFLIRGMADYGKLAVESLEWSDRSLLNALFEERLRASVVEVDEPWDSIWSRASVQYVAGRPVMDFLIDGSLMRPRYLIRLFETARRRALTFGRDRIGEDDYATALKELGWQVLEDLDREVVDIVRDGAEILFDVAQASDGLSVSKFKYIAGKRISDPADIDRLLDVMLWNGSVGVKSGDSIRYIFDAGYKRQFLRSLLEKEGDVELILHPTLLSAIS